MGNVAPCFPACKQGSPAQGSRKINDVACVAASINLFECIIIERKKSTGTGRWDQFCRTHLKKPGVQLRLD